jgi:hypothetical protein
VFLAAAHRAVGASRQQQPLSAATAQPPPHAGWATQQQQQQQRQPHTKYLSIYKVATMNLINSDRLPVHMKTSIKL